MIDRRILYLTTGSVYPTKIGGAQRSNLLWKSLTLIGNVDLVLVSDEKDLPSDVRPILEKKYGLKLWQSLGRRGLIGPWRFLRPLWPGRVDQISHHLGSKFDDYGPDPILAPPIQSLIQENHYDLIVGRYLHPACRAGLFGHHPLIIDVDDLDTEVYRSRASAPGTSPLLRPILRWNARRIDRVIRQRAQQADALWVCKESDRQLPEFSKGRILPNIPFTDNSLLPPFQPENSVSTQILCVSTWSHLPNILGMEDFLQRSWPQILQSVPTAALRIVGSRLQEKHKEKWSHIPGVQVVGFVDSLADEYRRGAFTIAPILSGGGTNIKIVESLAFGRTTVLTAFAHRGYDQSLLHRRHVWVASDNNLAEGCIHLLKNLEHRAAMSAAGRKIIEEKFSFSAFSSIVRDTVESVLSTSNR